MFCPLSSLKNNLGREEKKWNKKLKFSTMWTQKMRRECHNVLWSLLCINYARKLYNEWANDWNAFGH